MPILAPATHVNRLVSGSPLAFAAPSGARFPSLADVAVPACFGVYFLWWAHKVRHGAQLGYKEKSFILDWVNVVNHLRKLPDEDQVNDAHRRVLATLDTVTGVWFLLTGLWWFYLPGLTWLWAIWPLAMALARLIPSVLRLAWMPLK